MLRWLFWRTLALASALAAAGALAALLGGLPGKALRGRPSGAPDLTGLGRSLAAVPGALASLLPGWLAALAIVSTATIAGSAFTISILRLRARARREYVRVRVRAYRGDSAEPQALAQAFAALHAALSAPWWRRLHAGQPSVAVEVHCTRAADNGGERELWLAVCCPASGVELVETALRSAYPNLQLDPCGQPIEMPSKVLRLRKHREFTRRIWTADPRRIDRHAEPLMNALMTRMGACEAPAFTQIALTPAPPSLEWLAKRMYKAHEARLSRERREHAVMRDRSMVEDVELRGGLDVQHAALFFADIRVLATDRGDCRRIAAVLRARRAENRLVERIVATRPGTLGRYERSAARGEGNPLPSLMRGVLAPREVCELWQLPSVDYATVPFSRGSVPIAPAPPGVMRPDEGRGVLRDALGPVSIHVELRRQNTAVPGTVEQGKSSFLVASVAEDLRRQRCAVIVLDPKGDAAEAALSAVPPDRTCTLLDFADPTCGFNPLAVEAPADVIADYVVSALKNLFSDADIRASSDRYLRNAIIAVLAADRDASLWDAARLLSVGEEGYAYRRSIGARVRRLPELKEISSFFTAELTAQLADARSATTSKLDAPVNKLARLLNSPSIKRVLLNDSLRVDFDRVIAGGEVLIVKGALGGMGAGNTSVLMQLLVGMLDAALARQQDRVSFAARTAVALKIDEAPLVLNRGFAETIALKRSAGLETVACWQTDAQWVDREVRDQLDALFAHRVYFATASADDARAAAALTMAEFSDSIRPGVGRLSALGSPEVRLRLPRHHAIASWTTPEGRQAAFVAQTIPLEVDERRLAIHAAAQAARGGRRMTDLIQPHWEAAHTAGPTTTDAAKQSAPSPGEPRALPGRAAASYRELHELDRARGARRAPAPSSPLLNFEPEAADLATLALLGELGHVLSSQVHRRLNPSRSMTTTQRRLKRLADAGLIERLQFHRPDGGGVPMCCSLSPAGERLLLEAAERGGGTPAGPTARPSWSSGEGGEQGLGRVRRSLHAAGWALALASLTDAREIRGAHLSALVPPRPRGRPPGPDGLALPGGRAAHDFLRTIPSGDRVEAERFETIRPDATIVLSGPRPDRPDIDLLIELDDRCARPGWANKVERYDHFLSGWAELVERYRRGGRAVPAVVFVCRDAPRARECARRADLLLSACHAYAGSYPQSWEHPGRARVVFAAERDVHEGRLGGWGVPRLPAPLRSETTGDGSPIATAVRAPLPLGSDA
ncbi:MAG TPA: replication-relaxation family protein [Solirubrobacteraceae bacterium]